MWKTGPGQWWSNGPKPLIRQHTHLGMEDGALQGAAMSDLLWGNGRALGMCGEVNVSWLLFELTFFLLLLSEHASLYFRYLMQGSLCNWQCFQHTYSYFGIPINTIGTVMLCFRFSFTHYCPWVGNTFHRNGSTFEQLCPQYTDNIQ